MKLFKSDIDAIATRAAIEALKSAVKQHEPSPLQAYYSALKAFTLTATILACTATVGGGILWMFLELAREFALL